LVAVDLAGRQNESLVSDMFSHHRKLLAVFTLGTFMMGTGAVSCVSQTGEIMLLFNKVLSVRLLVLRESRS
jgi:hypothetical protein